MAAEVLFINAAVSSGILDKADRLFRNDDESVWVELIQNARRAGATRIEITIEQYEEEAGDCLVTIHDNGRGIQNFQDLLTLGGSGWSEDTQTREDPAGMGFYSLCRSAVEVFSGHQFVKITSEVFAGKTPAEVKPSTEFVPGTKIKFTRPSFKTQLEAALKRSAEFCPVPILLAGVPIPQRDFLAGALYRETIDGIEVGFGTAFDDGYNPYTDLNWNFYGARLRHKLKHISGYLPAGKTSGFSLDIRCNVRETARVKLQLPDRRAIIEDEFFEAFQQKVRTVGYRFLLSQDRHVLPFVDWQEAKKLGVELPEAAFLLTNWRADPQDEAIEPMFGVPEAQLLPDTKNVVLVARDLEDEYTLEGALHSGANFEGTLYREEPAFIGYTWYDQLPMITESAVYLDGTIYERWSQPERGRPDRIELELTIDQPGMPTRAVSLTAFIHVRPDAGLSFVATKKSPWDNDELAGPFSIHDFLLLSTFRASDDFGECDSWQTQKDRYDEEVEREVNAYFRGPLGTLLAILRKSIDWEANRLARELSIAEIRFSRDGDRGWNVELVPAVAPAEEPPS